MKYILYYLLIGIIIDIIFVLIVRLRNQATNGETVKDLDLLFKDTMILVITMPVMYPAWAICLLYVFFIFIASFIEDIPDSESILKIKNKIFKGEYAVKKYPRKFNEFPEQCQHCSNLKTFSLDMSGNHDYMCHDYLIHMYRKSNCPYYSDKNEFSEKE